ncbi:MAG: hypothetical protein NC489_23475, partial [Ruminococcus flavefaciens]|nr:hypothetical protein [Ruminococcus flavefaciens]
MKIKHKSFLGGIAAALLAVFVGGTALAGVGFGNKADVANAASANGSASVYGLDDNGSLTTAVENKIQGAQKDYIHFGPGITTVGNSSVSNPNDTTKWVVLKKNDTKYGSGKNLLLWSDKTYNLNWAVGGDYRTSLFWGTSWARALMNGETVDGVPYEYYRSDTGALLSVNPDWSFINLFFNDADNDYRHTLKVSNPIITRVVQSLDPSDNPSSWRTLYSSVMSIPLTVNANAGKYYSSTDTSITGGLTNVYGDKVTGDRMFFLDYDDLFNADYGFVDSNNKTLVEGIVATMNANTSNTFYKNYVWSDWRDGYPSYAEAPFLQSTALKTNGSGYYLRNHVIGSKGGAWTGSGGASFTYSAYKVPETGSNAGTTYNCKDIVGLHTYAPGIGGSRMNFVLDLEQVVYANSSKGNIGATFEDVSSAASGTPEYKIYIKDKNYATTNSGFTPIVTASSNKLKVTFSNTTAQSGNMVVLLRDRNSTDGSVAYQGVKSFSSDANKQEIEFTLPAGISYKDYKPTVMLTSANTVPTAAMATERVYATYTQDGVIVPQDISLAMEYSDTASKATHWLDNLNLKAVEGVVPDAPTWIDLSMHCDPTVVKVKEIKFTSSAAGAVETTINGADTTKIKNAGIYTVVMEIADPAKYHWQGGGTGEKSFKMTVSQAEIDPFNVAAPTGTAYSGITTDDFPEIKPPTAWEGKGTLAWDSGQTLSTTKNYKWTFTPDEETNATDYADSAYKISNYQVKTGETQITVTAVSVGSISAEYTGTGDIFTSTKLDDLLKNITVTKTNNDGSAGGTADPSELEFKTGTKLTAGKNVKLTVQLKGTNITCEVEIPEVLEVKPVALDVTHDGSPVYTSTGVSELKGQVTVKVKNNDGTDGKTLTVEEFKF